MIWVLMSTLDVIKICWSDEHKSPDSNTLQQLTSLSVHLGGLEENTGGGGTTSTDVFIKVDFLSPIIFDAILTFDSDLRAGFWLDSGT